MSNAKRNAAMMGVLALVGASGTALAGGPGPWGPDITLCQLYGLSQFGRAGNYPSGTLGLACATTSWNIGTARADWYQSPDSRHPFIVMNMYRRKNVTINGTTFTRFEQIGQSWIKHGFFALSNTQCGPHPFIGGNCQGTNGSQLGIGCTDTYGASLNASQSGLGPRYEVNPWTGAWSYTGSIFQTGGGPGGGAGRRLQVREQDLIPPTGQSYNLFYEAYYVAHDDVDVMNSAGWKPVNSYSNNFSGTNAGSVTWSFSSTGSTTPENEGWAIDAWVPTATTYSSGQTLFAQELPIVEKWSANNPPRPGFPAPGPESPDGRGIVAWQVTDLGGGLWQYEYTILNIDVDRQIGSFNVPVPDGVNVTNIGWSGVFHHNESKNGPLTDPNSKNIDNNPWTSVRNSSGVTWSTVPYASSSPSNPIRWGTAYNFWFTADQPPINDRTYIGLFKPGSPDELRADADMPQAPPPPPFCMGDANSDFVRDFADISAILGNWGASYTPGSAGLGDSNNDGEVNFSDLTTTLAFFGQPC